jgi:DNA mismatch repair protein MutS2
VAFDLATLAPTYRLEVGAPGGSQAFAIAARLGLPEALLHDAQSRRSDQGATLDAALAAATEAERAAREARSVAEGLQERAADALEQAVEHRRAAERESAKVRAEATDLARASATSILERVEQLRGELESGSLTPKSLQMAGDLAKLVSSSPDPLAPSELEANVELSALTLAAAVGNDVVLRSGSRGTLLAVDGDEATVALGRMHSAVPIAEIAKILVSPATVPQSTKRPAATIATAKLDLRGARVEDALAALEARIVSVGRRSCSPVVMVFWVL